MGNLSSSLFIGLLIASGFFSAVTAHASFDIEGMLKDTEGYAIEGPAQVWITVYQSETHACLLYSERHTVTPDASGLFVLQVGKGSPTSGFTTLNVDSIFNNSETQTCRQEADGASVSQFTPTLDERRSLLVRVHTAKTGTIDIGSMQINAVPLATVATMANKVGKHSESSLLRVENLGAPQNKTAITPDEFDEFLKIIRGTTDQYPKMSSAKIPASVIPISGGSGVSIDSSSGTIMISATGSGGTVTSVTADAPLSVTSASPSPVVSIPKADASRDGYLSKDDWNTFAMARVPAGSVMTMMTANCPTGYLKADGSSVSRDGYPDLFNSIGTMYGSGDGSTTFGLPDLRGMFLRGVNEGSSQDPDASSRTARPDGTTGDAVGTRQGDSLAAHAHGAGNLSGTTTADGAHSHSISGPPIVTSITFVNQDIYNNSDGERTYANASVSTNLNLATDTAGAHTHAVTVNSGATASTGSSETRPKNISVLYCIKW